ncbi:MAG: GlsB/YeaQ/YmgE family stress response membrane protein [Chloroflexi bacterium]|nr:GlsB/YeaQ/YmgE family stress response membrane protein [Chloroflexota bacterium]
MLLALAIWAVIGWLAGKLFRGQGYGALGNILLGLGGGVVGGILFALVGLSSGGLIGSILSGVVGSVVVLWGARLLNR